MGGRGVRRHQLQMGSIEIKRAEMAERDREAPDYEHTWRPAWIPEIELPLVIDLLDVQPGQTVLDLGAGVGRVTRELVGQGRTIVALDYSLDSLRMNRQHLKAVGNYHGRVAFLLADATTGLPFPAESFDRVACIQMIQHVPTYTERVRLLSEAYRVLKPGGVLVLTTYNRSFMAILRRRRDGFHGGKIYYHLFSVAELRRLLRAFGKRRLFGILNLTPRLYGKPFSSLLERVIQRLPISYLTGSVLVARCVKT